MKLIDLKDQMLKILSTAQKERDQRRGQVTITNAWNQTEDIPEWALYEMNVMKNTVNSIRESKQLPPITLTDIMRVESGACGHCDYSSKFALYCAELTFKSEKEIQYP